MQPPRTMITFKSEGIHFTNRVGGILIQDEHVLCQAASDENFFFQEIPECTVHIEEYRSRFEE